MKLDHSAMFVFKHSAGDVGNLDTLPPDEGTSGGPISLHDAIGVPRVEPSGL